MDELVRRRAMIAVFLVLGVAHVPARARWTDFAPKPFENALYVDVFGSGENEDSSGSANTANWRDLFFKEQVTLFSRGYIYHPRFLGYRVSLSGALKQEDYTASASANTGWMKGTGFEYEFRFLFLPEHPYNVDLYALRYEPLYMEQSATSHTSVETNNGVQFRFRRKPWFAHAGYMDNSTDSFASDANVKRLVADGLFSKGHANGNQTSINAAFSDANFSSSDGVDGTNRDAAAGASFKVARAHLTANVSDNTLSQDSPISGRYENDRRAFNELLSVDLPLEFTTDFAYHWMDNDSTRSSRNGGDVMLSETSRLFQFDLSQKVYWSLDWRYTFLRNQRASTAGDSTLTTHRLGFNYRKNIPRGHLMADVFASRNDSDNSGRTDVVSESHPAVGVPGSFTLDHANAQAGSLDVTVTSPVAPYETIHLVEGVEYTTLPLGNTLQVSILSLPAPFVLPGTYAFAVTYSLVSGEFELLTKNYFVNTSVALLDNMLTPYFGYTAVRSDVVSGYFPSTNLDSTIYTLGLSFLDGPWRAHGEYQSVDWSVSPYDSLLGDVQYVGSVARSTRVYAIGSYLYRRYSEGASPQQSLPGVDRIVTATASVQQDFLAKRLLFAAGVSYTKQTGRVISSSYSLNASLTYRIGKLFLAAGTSGFGTETQAYGTDPYSRNHQYYFFRLRREFSR